MSNANWILRNGVQSIDCISFPYAFRTAFNIVRKTIDAKKDPSSVIKGLIILGPINGRGERTKYNYSQATELARTMDVLTIDGNINSKNMQIRR